MFKSQSYLKLHIKRIHIKSKTHSCEFCEKTFSLTTDLQTHVINVHEKNYKCDQCGKAFGKSDYLKEHIKGVHEKIKDNICEECGIAFRDELILHHDKYYRLSQKRGWGHTGS